MTVVTALSIMVIKIQHPTYLSSTPQSWGWAWYHCIHQGETKNGEDVFEVERGRFGGVRVLLFLGSSLLFFVFIST